MPVHGGIGATVSGGGIVGGSGTLSLGDHGAYASAMGGVGLGAGGAVGITYTWD